MIDRIAIEPCGCHSEEKLVRWRLGRCPHAENVGGLRADCLPCHVDMFRDAEIKAEEGGYVEGLKWAASLVLRDHPEAPPWYPMCLCVYCEMAKRIRAEIERREGVKP